MAIQKMTEKLSRFVFISMFLLWLMPFLISCTNTTENTAAPADEIADVEPTRPTVLIVATDYPPYEFENPEDGLRGFDVEVVDEAFNRVGIEATFEFYPWARAMMMTEEGKATAALTCARNEERESFILFSDTISLMTDVFLVYKDYDGPPLSRMQDLQGTSLNVGTGRGTAYIDRLEELGIPYDLSNTEEISLQKLADRRIDVMPAIVEYISYSIRKAGLEGQFKWFTMEEVQTNEFHLCFSKAWVGSEEIVPLFNQALQSMKEDGTYEAIHAKYR